MARTERLMELADLLRGRASTTVDSLSEELGVSRRTLLRDLSALRGRGMIITGEAGPGGGVRLEGDRGRTAVEFSLSEVVAIWLAARLSHGASELPWGRAASSGMAKLLGSLPLAKTLKLRALCQRVIVGAPAGAHLVAELGTAPPELLRIFEEAFSSGRCLGFQYSDRDGNRSARRVEPHGLLVVTPIWYVLGRDLKQQAARMFRMDRISRPVIVRDVTFQPEMRFIQAMFTDLKRWRPLAGEWTP